MDPYSFTPSQEKTIESLRENILAGRFHEGYEYKRFEIHPFTSNPKILEVLIEVGKTNESPMEAITHRFITQIWVGERGGCEMSNPEKTKPIKGLNECIESFTECAENGKKCLTKDLV